MSQDRYFDKFPVISYNNTNAVDITKRIVFLNDVMKNPYLFYPYEISADERADQFSFRYYEDQYKSWVVYLSNQIVDPYYEWYMEDSIFNDFVKKKYGDLELAALKIKHYECNWQNDKPISVSEFNSLLINLKRYWEPNFEGSNRIINYKRKKIDQIFNTNKMIKYDVVDSSKFKKEEICSITSTNPAISGRGQISAIVGNIIYLHHVSGSSIFPLIGGSNPTYYLNGRESKATTTITKTTLIQNNLLPEEEIYWSPVSYYQFELNKNAFNKTIKVLDRTYAKQVADNLESIMK